MTFGNGLKTVASFETPLNANDNGTTGRLKRLIHGLAANDNAPGSALSLKFTPGPALWLRAFVADIAIRDVRPAATAPHGLKPAR